MTREEILKLAKKNEYRGSIELVFLGQVFRKDGFDISDLEAIIELAPFIWGEEEQTIDLNKDPFLYGGWVGRLGPTVFMIPRYKHELYWILSNYLFGHTDVIEYVSKSLEK